MYTADDLELEPFPPSMGMLNQQMLRTALATDRVRYVGEPVAVVVADSLSAGVDAAALVLIDYEPLPAVIERTDALAADTMLFPEAGSNVAFSFPSEAGDDFFADCEVTVELSFRNQRLAPCPLEPRAAIARWDRGDDGAQRLTQWATTQGAHGTRDSLATATGVDPSMVRVICPDVGGGFGAKHGNYVEEVVVALLARQLDRPIRWAETRTESMLGLVHGRGCDFTATIGGTRDGRVTAYQVVQPAGRRCLPGGRLGAAVHHPDHGDRRRTTSPTSTSRDRRW